MPAEVPRLPADERRALTVEAVVALAAKGDPSEITTTAIAEHMNLTQGALFRHFPNKDAIWEAVITWVSDRVLTRGERAAASADSPIAALEAIFLTHIDFVTKHPGVPRMLFGELQRTAKTPAKRIAQGLLRRNGERLQTLLEQGKSQGQIAADLDTKAAATLFIGMIQGLVVQAILNGNIEAVRKTGPAAFAIYRRGIEVSNANTKKK